MSHSRRPVVRSLVTSFIVSYSSAWSQCWWHGIPASLLLTMTTKSNGHEWSLVSAHVGVTFWFWNGTVWLLTIWCPAHCCHMDSYKASCARPGSAVFCNFWHPGALTLSPGRQWARMSKITNDGLTRFGTGCFMAEPLWQQWASKG